MIKHTNVDKDKLDFLRSTYGRFGNNRKFYEAVLSLNVNDALEVTANDLVGNYHSPHSLMASLRCNNIEVTGDKYSTPELLTL